MRRFVYRAVGAAGFAIGSALGSAASAQSAGFGKVIGFVTSKESAQPLAFADVSVEGTSVKALSSWAGAFSISGVPAGDIRLRIRRVGFTPAFVNVKIRANTADTVRVELAPLALELDRVTVRDNVCPNTRGRADTAVVAVLQQLQIGAERADLLANQLPFTSAMQRVIGNLHAFTDLANESWTSAVTVDTLEVGWPKDWQYEPGKLVQTDLKKVAGSVGQMKVPDLTDFASPAFVGSHCYRYAGVRNVDGVKLAEIDIEPAPEVRTADVHGALYLEPATYRLARSTLYLDMTAPNDPLQTWNLRVDTWFRDIVPALPAIDHICKKITVRAQRGFLGASYELQRLVGFAFNDTTPTNWTPLDLRSTKESRAALCPNR